MGKKVSLRGAVAVGLAAVITSSTGVYMAMRPSESERQLMQSIHEVQTLVEDKFVGEYDMDTVTDYTLAGYVAGLGDRWSTYQDKESYENYQKTTSETTVGIGVTVSYREREDGTHDLYVVKVAHQSPAQKAGVEPYDAIIGVGGKSIDEIGDYEDAVNVVRGEEGTDVVITVEKADGGQQDYTITRQQYEQIYVYGKLIEQNIGWITIERFITDTDDRLADTIAQLQKEGAEKLIFDLRGNPGGRLDALVDSLDPLLPEGDIITLTDKQGNSETFPSDAEELDMPMAVIVDEDSYSAAEFFAAALQSYGKAVVIGEQTYGKGYSQITYPLSNGGALSLSVDCYYMPNGESLIGKGVIPDKVCSLSKEKKERFYTLTPEEDDQLQEAIKALS